MIGRRTALVGWAALGLAGLGGLVLVRVRNDSDDYARAVQADYLEGRVADRYGWIMSNTEAARVPGS